MNSIDNLPIDLCFSAGQCFGDQAHKESLHYKGGQRLQGLEDKKAMAYLGDQPIGRYSYQDGSLVPHDSSTTKKMLDRAALGFYLYAGSAWVRADEEIPGQLPLDHLLGESLRLVFQDSRRVAARGELVLVDEVFALRVQSLVEEELPQAPGRQWVEYQAVIGETVLDLAQLEQIGIGSIILLNRSPLQGTLLYRHGRSFAQGYIKCRTNREWPVQCYQPGSTAGQSQGLVFQLPEHKGQQKESHRELDLTQPSLDSIVKTLSSMGLEELKELFCGMAGSLVPTVLKMLAVYSSEKAASLLDFMFSQQGEPFLQDFVKVKLHRAKRFLAAPLWRDLKQRGITPLREEQELLNQADSDSWLSLLEKCTPQLTAAMDHYLQ